MALSGADRQARWRAKHEVEAAEAAAALRGHLVARADKHRAAMQDMAEDQATAYVRRVLKSAAIAYGIYPHAKWPDGFDVLILKGMRHFAASHTADKRLVIEALHYTDLAQAQAAALANQRHRLARHRLPANQRNIATHEAGHAVIARVLTIPSEGVSIIRNKRSLGRNYGLGYGGVACRWLDGGKWRGSLPETHIRAAWHAEIITLMAGAEAEEVITGRVLDGSSEVDDAQILDGAFDVLYPHVVFDAFDWQKREARLRRMARMLVRRHRARIERVAEALLAQKKLTGQQVDRLIGSL